MTITRPDPPQWWQVRAMEKKPWVSRISPEPPQVGQARGPVPGLAPLPWQDSQGRARGMVMRATVPKAASSKPISDVVAQVGPAGPRSGATASSAKHLTEDVAEDVVDVSGSEGEVLAALAVCMAEPVVASSLLGIGEDLHRPPRLL